MAELHAAVWWPHSGSGQQHVRGLLDPTSVSPDLPLADRSGIPNWFTLTQAITGPKAGTNQYGFRDVLSTTRGKHTLYLGGEAGLEKDFQHTSLDNYGVFAFTTAARHPHEHSLSDYMPGTPNTI